jgi:Tat protein translocase TatB subunit
MFNVGGLEMVVIAVVALLVFGPKRLPEVSRQVGGALRELRRVQTQVKSDIDDALRVDDVATAPKSQPRAALQTRPIPEPGRPDAPPDIDDDGPIERDGPSTDIDETDPGSSFS